LKNVRYVAGSLPLEARDVRAAITDGETRLKTRGGRLLIRKSGTEPLIRVMGESEDEALLASVLDDITGAISAVG
jgi:phosphoglucosamine mutase